MGMHLHLTAGGLHRPTVLEKCTRIVAMAPALILNVYSVRSRELQIGLIGIRKTPIVYELATDARGEGLAAGD